jgi:hypothetical protein
LAGVASEKKRIEEDEGLDDNDSGDVVEVEVAVETDRGRIARRPTVVTVAPLDRNAALQNAEFIFLVYNARKM